LPGCPIEGPGAKFSTSRAMGPGVHRAIGLAFLLLAAPSVGGCARVERARHCQELAEKVSPRLEEVARLAAGRQVPAALRAIAGGDDGSAAELGRLEFPRRARARAGKDYGLKLREIAAEARRAAAARENEDRSQHSAARREVRQ